MLVSRGQPVSIIRHSGVIFDGEQGRKYASVIGRIVESVQAGLDEVSTSDSDTVNRAISIPLCSQPNMYSRTKFGS